MRIGQIATVATTVREEGSDSIESLVWLLSRELIRAGHEVTVFAAGGSEPPGEVIASLPGPYGTSGAPDDWQLCEWINLCRAVECSDRFDVLHSHAYLWGLPLSRLSRAPMVHTLHTCPYEDEARLVSLVPEACVTAISHYQWHAFPDLRPATVIPHGVDPEQFPFRAKPDDYVCYLGRFIPGKGPLEAIAAARKLGVPLVLAGPGNDYFRDQVAPLVDGRQVQYAGFVTGGGRARLLGGARALLYPLVSPEPFGLVQAEAMMCGTPVIANRIGAVPEIVDEGVTGFSATSAEEFGRQIPRAFELDRNRIRKQAEARFSVESMAGAYLALYERLMVDGRQRVAAWRP
jgi:glycosyltransferase involved in cell wall biosynthesis